MSTIYEPGEDSYLLARQVQKYAKGKVLDMGCGSGILGIYAAKNKNVTEVTFSDLNIDALSHISNTVKLDIPMYCKHSDIFSKLKRKYDTIIFNPPYLPNDNEDNEKLITTGGEHGYEILDRFLEKAKDHLLFDGIILIVFSSLTDKGHVDKTIKQQNFEKLELAKDKVFMETLYVYQLKVKDPSIIRGHRGIVQIQGKIVVKKAKTEHYNASEEAKFLKLLNKHGIGPKYKSHSKNSLKMEYIKGERILDFIKNSTKEEILTILDRILEQLYTMDKLKINKQEMTNPYKHIIIRNYIPYMIDFERCAYTQKPKNVTQFIQYIISKKKTLEEKGVKVQSELLLDIAKSYKKRIDIDYIKDIIDSFQ